MGKMEGNGEIRGKMGKNWGKWGNFKETQEKIGGEWGNWDKMGGWGKFGGDGGNCIMLEKLGKNGGG